MAIMPLAASIQDGNGSELWCSFCMRSAKINPTTHFNCCKIENRTEFLSFCYVVRRECRRTSGAVSIQFSSVQLLAFSRSRISISLLCTAHVQSVILTARNASVDDGCRPHILTDTIVFIYCLFSGASSG
jgi:hypothetical protein